MRAPLQARNDSDAKLTDTPSSVAQERAFEDNRPATVAQRKLADMMNDSPRVSQQRALSEAIHKSSNTEAQRQEETNNTGVPKQLKSGIESLSGMRMDHVKVHYHSDKPAQLQAHAYAQGNEIHLATGQEKHLPHEAWHVVQQAQGRVRPTFQMNTGAINDDPSLEKEADAMGGKAAQFGSDHGVLDQAADAVTQRVLSFDRAPDKKLAHTPVRAGAPVQRAVLMQDGDVNSFVPTTKRLKNELIMAGATEAEQKKNAEFSEMKTVNDALEVLRETDTGFNFSDVLAAFQARHEDTVSDKTAKTLTDALNAGTLAQAGLSADDRVILKENLRLCPYITTDDERAAASRAKAESDAIARLKTLFPGYVNTFKHIFKGDFSAGSAKVPTGYHAENGGSATHETYGTTTALDHNTYQKSVRATDKAGKKKPFQSTFFPSTASEEDIKLAVVSGDKRSDKTVQYPRSLEGLPLKKTGVTIYPATGTDQAAE